MSGVDAGLIHAHRRPPVKLAGAEGGTVAVTDTGAVVAGVVMGVGNGMSSGILLTIGADLAAKGIETLLGNHDDIRSRGNDRLRIAALPIDRQTVE